MIHLLATLIVSVIAIWLVLVIFGSLMPQCNQQPKPKPKADAPVPPDLRTDYDRWLENHRRLNR